MPLYFCFISTDIIMARGSYHACSQPKLGANLKLIAFILSFALWITQSNAARFLIVLGPDKGSMMFTTLAIGDALIERRQNVTILADEIIADRVRTHNPKFDLEIYKSTVTTADVAGVEQRTTERALSGFGYWTGIYWAQEMIEGLFHQQCRDLLKQDDVISRIRQSEFDLVLASLGHICPMFVAKHIDVPFVGLMQSFLPLQWAHAYHQPINSAYMPPAYTGWTDKMTFQQRLLAALMSITHWPVKLTEPLAFPNFVRLKDDYNISPGKSVFWTFGEAELTFAMSHVVLDYPHPVQPNTIIVGGLTTKPAKPLNKNLEDFMQSSGDNGVLVFAMGTTTQGANKDFSDIFSNVFAKLSLKVIWKLGGDRPENIPSNVMTTKWLPQNDLLGHPKTKIFVSHCGLNGVFEALYHAVPIVCIPMFGDHIDAAARVRSKEIGIEIALEDLTSEVLNEAIRTILEEKKYRENIQRLSTIYRDEPLSPAHTCAYWMEYVVRHGGAGHLRSAAHDLSFIQYHLLDVVFVLLVLCVLVLTLTCWVMRTICRCCCRACRSHSGQKDKSD